MKSQCISIKFCGGCNPRIDRGAIAKRLRETLAISGFQVTFNQLTGDLIIYLSGCTVNCAQRYNRSDIACITVAGTSVDACTVEETNLVDEIMDRVSDRIGKLEKYIPE